MTRAALRKSFERSRPDYLHNKPMGGGHRGINADRVRAIKLLQLTRLSNNLMQSQI